MQIRCTELKVVYPSSKGIPALDSVSLCAKHGEFLTVLGPSGCGKSTLLRAIAGLIEHTGTVDRQPAAEDRNPSVLLVFQENSLFPWMTVLDNAAYGLKARGVPKEQRDEAAHKLLHRFGLAGRERCYPSELSVGMKQRVAVIRCFLVHPAGMLLDEPFSALDPQTRLALQEELLALWEQDRKTVIFVTHDIEEALLLSDRILIMDRQPGRITSEIRVPFGRPRSVALTLSDEFLSLKREIWTRLDGRFAGMSLRAAGLER